jgi:hypothetical protein
MEERWDCGGHPTTFFQLVTNIGSGNLLEKINHWLKKSHQPKREREKHKERKSKAKTMPKNEREEKTSTQIQIPSLVLKPLTYCVKQIKQREWKESWENTKLKIGLVSEDGLPQDDEVWYFCKATTTFYL